MKKIKVYHVVIFIVVLALILPYIYLEMPDDAERLIKAIENDDIDRLEKLLEDGNDPNKPTEKPSILWTILESSPKIPLAKACEYGNIEMVKLLIKYGATARHIEGTSWSPLRETLWFYQTDDVEIVKLLLENGAEVDLEESGDLPVFAAARIPPHVFDRNNTNGTHYYEGRDEEAQRGITEIVTLLLGNQSINIVNSWNETLLFEAVKAENVYLVEYLLSQGCDKNIQNHAGKTALDYAVERGYVEIVDLLS